MITLRLVRATRDSTILDAASCARSFSALAAVFRSRFALSRSRDSACSVLSALSLSEMASSEYSFAYSSALVASRLLRHLLDEGPNSQYSYGNVQIGQYCTSRAGKWSTAGAGAPASPGAASSAVLIVSHEAHLASATAAGANVVT